MANKILGVKSGDWDAKRESQGLFGITRETRTIIYVVLADSVNATDTDIYNNTPNLPQVNGTISGLNGRIKSVEIKEADPNSKLWDVSFMMDNAQGFVNPVPPEQQQPEWSWSVEFEQRAVEEEVGVASPKPLATTAGEPTPIEIPYPIPVLNIVRYELSFDPDTIYGYVNHVNDTTFWGALSGNVLCSGISDRKEEIDDVDYRQVSYTFKFKIDWFDAGGGDWQQRTEGWQARLADYGTFYYINANPALTNEKRHFRVPKDTNEQALDPWLWTGPKVQGKVRDGGYNTSDDMDYNDFVVYRSVDFNTLNLGPW